MMMDNLYDQDEMKETAADIQPAAVSHVQPDNFFAETVGEAPARPGANETIVPKTTPGRSWRDELMDGVSLDNARESARARTEAEKKNPRVETPQEASLWGAMEHTLGNRNAEAFADSMDHLADWTGDQWWSRKAQSIRDSLEKDGSSYRPVYESFSNIGGLKDAWGYTKERLGQGIGYMLPSVLGAAALGGIGASQGELVGGKTGAMVGGAVGGMAGATLGTIHLQVSDMRQALRREGLEGEDLVKYTNMGAAILTSLDMAFPALQAAKIGGFARKQVSEKVAQHLVQNLIQGGKMRTAAETVKQIGRNLIKDAVMLEVPTELAQEALTELGAKPMAGKSITAGDVQKFALETAPEIILSTIIGAGGMSLPGSSAKAYRDVRDAHKAAEFPGDKPSTGTEATGPDAPPQAPIDGSPEPGIQPPMEDPSREVAPNPAAGAKGQGVIRFIQSMGGMQPSGELDALDAHRYPGLINQAGKSADEMREALVEAGYLEESGPDQPNITTPDDVYDLIQRAISGERIVPLQDQQADADFHAALETKDAEKELNWAEKQFVLPAIEHYDEEAGDPILSQAYRKLSPDERIQVIDRVRRGEDVFNVVEEIFTYNVNTEVVAAMVQAYGPNPELVERIRTMIAQQQPDLLVGFDDMVAQFPTRRPKVAREPVRRAGDEPTELVRGMGGRLKAIAGDAQAFNIALGEIERDRKILKDDAFRIASDFLGQPPKKGTKASYFQAIRDAQANPGAPAPVNVEQTSAKLSKEPAVPVQQSVAPEAITSLIDGSKHIDLTKHLDKLGIDVEDYARNYRLAENYPLVAENAVAERHGKTRQTEDFETYAKRFTIGGVRRAREEAAAKAAEKAGKTVETVDLAKPDTQAEVAPERDLMQELIRLANSRTPRDEWGAVLGLQPFQLNTAITQAVQAGILAYDKRGVARRAPIDQVKDATGIVAEFNALLDEAMPTEKDKVGRNVPIAAAATNWQVRAKMLLEQIKRIPLAEAQKIAPTLLGRKGSRTELASRPKIVDAATRRIDSITDSRLKAGLFSGSAAFIAPGTLANENVMLTPEAESKAEVLQRVVDDAVAGILPANVRVDVVANIEIGRLAREDELYALRSSRSDIMSDTEVSDELPGDGRKAGEEGDGASESGAPAGTAATRGGGFATGKAGGEGRILRQESATLRSDGSVFAGRQLGEGRPVNAGDRDGAKSQPFGRTEQFEAPDGFSGYVTADEEAPHERLARNNAPKSMYRLGKLTYRLYQKGTKLPSSTENPKYTIGAGLIHATVSQHLDGTWEVSWVQRLADDEVFPKNMSDQLYAAIEKDLGIKMSPSGLLSKAGHAMWERRSPESVKWHQWSVFDGYFVSPRRIKDRLDEIGPELKALSARAATGEQRAQIDLANARKERGELIKLWTKLPVEARAETPNMFSLAEDLSETKIVDSTGAPMKLYHGTGVEFDRFDPAFSVEGGIFFASDVSIAKDYTFRGGKKKRVIESYADIRNPKIVDAKGENFADAMLGKPADEADGDRFTLTLPKLSDKAKSFGDYAVGREMEVSTPNGQKMEILVGIKEARAITFRNVTRHEVTYDILSPKGQVFRSGEKVTVLPGEDPDQSLRTSVKLSMDTPFNSHSLPRLFLKQAIDEAKAEGHDGLWMRNGVDMGREAHDQIVAFNSDQIKIVGEDATGAGEFFSLSDNAMGRPVRALGQTDPRAELISISAQAVEQKARKSGQSMAEITKTVARHEALEFFLAMGLINAPEWSALQAAARKEGWVDQTGVRKAYTDHYGKTMGPRQLEDLILKESIMEMYGRYRADQYAPKGMVRMLFKRISDLIDKIVSGFKGEGFQTWEDIFRKVDEGELKRRYEEIYGRTDQPNTQAMIRAGVIPDARGIAQAPGATRVTQPHAPKNMAQQAVQRFLPRQRPLKALSELMKDFQQAAGLSVRTGRIDPALQRQATAAGGGQVLGQYNGVARLRVQRDFDIFSHEAGHHIERLLGGRLTVAMNAFSHELLPLAGIVAGNQNTMLREGFAEFFRRYLTNEAAARAQAPGFYRTFENLVEAENPRLFWTLQDIQDEYDNFLLGDPLDRGAAQQTVLTRPTSATRRFFQDAERDGFVSTMADRLYDLHHGFIQSVFDKRHGWWMATRGLLNEIERLTGNRVTLNAADNPNKLIRMTSHTQAWAMQDLKEGIALRGRPNGRRVSMHQVLATAFGGTAQSAWNEARARAFGDYLIARRAVLLYVRYRPQFRVQIQQFVAANPQMGFLLARLPNNAVSDLPNPPTAEPLYEHLNRLLEHERRNPQFRQAAELYYSFNKDMIQLLYEKGLITLEEKNEYQQDRDYCPFQRNMEDRELVDNADNRSKRPPRGRDKANKYDVYREIQGSMRDIINPIQSTVQTMFEIRLRAAINDTLAAMDRVARQAGQAGNEIFERLPPTEARAVEVRIREQLRQAARAAGMTATDTAIMLTNVESQIGQNVVTTMFTQSQASEKGEKIVWFFENGKPIPAQLPDGTLGQMMFHGLTAVGQRNMGQLMDAAAWTAGVARTGVTFSFGFMIRNIITDSIASWVNSPYARPVLTQAAGAREIISSGRYLHLYNRYAGMMGGAGHAALSDQSIERDIHALRQRGFAVRVPRSLRDLVKAVFQIGEFSETATRVGIFRNAMISAERDGLSQFDAAIEAAHYAHDVMDFSQHGSKTEAFRRVIPFFNAALQGIYKYGKTLTAANDYGNLIQIWDRQMRGQPLSRNEQRALGQAGKAWLISTVVLGSMSLIFAMLGADDDDMKEVPDQIRATHWRISLNGVLHLLPKDIRVFLAGENEKTDWMIRLPKPFEIGWFANATERAWDYLVNSDPTAASGMVSDFFTTVMPPHSIAAADLVYGFVFGKDMYSGNDIVPIWEKGPNEIERKEQYGPYTSWAARQIGEALNMSPYYAEFIIRNLTTSVGQDAAAGIDAALGEGPELSIAEYPAARRFTYNSGKSSQSLGKFYNMMTDGEGLSKWFWDTFSSDARSFHSAGNTYGKMIDAGGESSAIAAEFLSRINPDQRVFAVLSNDFKGRTKSKYRNLHPMLNAEEGVKIANAVMKEVVSGELIMNKGEKGEERKKMDREQMRFARNEVGHIRKGMAQNALQIMGVDGWREQKLMDVDARFKTLKSGAPEVYTEMMRRLKEKKVQDGKHLAKVWGKVRERVDTSRKDADLGDLYGPVVGQE
jgi:predicted transcriptional regulator